MSKLGCVCGHVIRDQTDDIAYKARFVRDQDYEGFYAYAGDIAAFIAATQAASVVSGLGNISQILTQLTYRTHPL